MSNCEIRMLYQAGPCSHTLERKRQTDLFEFKVSLVYTLSSRTVRAIQRNLNLCGAISYKVLSQNR